MDFDSTNPSAPLTPYPLPPFISFSPSNLISPSLSSIPLSPLQRNSFRYKHVWAMTKHEQRRWEGDLTAASEREVRESGKGRGEKGGGERWPNESLSASPSERRQRNSRFELVECSLCGCAILVMVKLLHNWMFAKIKLGDFGVVVWSLLFKYGIYLKVGLSDSFASVVLEGGWWGDCGPSSQKLTLKSCIPSTSNVRDGKYTVPEYSNK